MLRCDAVSLLFVDFGIANDYRLAPRLEHGLKPLCCELPAPPEIRLRRTAFRRKSIDAGRALRQRMRAVT
jgi:hypothetical protein